MSDLLVVKIGAVTCDTPCLLRAAGYTVGFAAYVLLGILLLRWWGNIINGDKGNG